MIKTFILPARPRHGKPDGGPDILATDAHDSDLSVGRDNVGLVTEIRSAIFGDVEFFGVNVLGHEEVTEKKKGAKFPTNRREREGVRRSSKQRMKAYAK